MNRRNYNIDVLKAIAIIAVILLHSLSTDMLFNVLAPIHIWQAVPIFMILVGYNTANSYERKGPESLKDLYNGRILIRKFQKLIIPFAFVWIMQVFIHYILLGGLNVRDLLISFFVGGWGPGSYFVPLIVQATLITPLIYYVLKRNMGVGAVGLFLISVGLEVFSLSIDMTESIYRLLIIRYVFAITLGCWFALYKDRRYYKWLLPLSILSLIYIIGVNYFGWHVIMEHYWQSQHVFSYFWPLLLIVVMLNFYKIKATHIISKSFVKVGQASYHIFLVQMFYFWIVFNQLPDYSEFVLSLISIVMCVVLGVLFLKVDNIIRQTIHNQVYKKTIVS